MIHNFPINFQCEVSSRGGKILTGGEFDPQSDSSHPYTYSTKTDSELSHYSFSAPDGPGGSSGMSGMGGRMPKRLPRRRLLSSEEFSDMLEDDDDADVDDEQFMLERQKSRKERLQVMLEIVQV